MSNETADFGSAFYRSLCFRLKRILQSGAGRVSFQNGIYSVGGLDVIRPGQPCHNRSGCNAKRLRLLTRTAVKALLEMLPVVASRSCLFLVFFFCNIYTTPERIFKTENFSESHLGYLHHI